MDARSCNRVDARAHASSIHIAFFIMAMGAISGPVVAQVDIAQKPLHVGPRVPGNLALVLSVEFPTIISQANLGPYAVNRRYIGYFDPDKCYHYHYSEIESERHFYPVRFTTGHLCNHSSKEWSGNFMNWAVTQTIDPFRLALTGGYRVRDTPVETWLEKARHDRYFEHLYDDRRLPGTGADMKQVRGATPASWNQILVQVRGLGNQILISPGVARGSPVAYNPEVHDLVTNARGQAFPFNDLLLSARVKVCVPNLLELNCKQYSQGWKPEGLIQEYSDRVRYSIFGYLNDSRWQRDGGVLRANQKFVGPYSYDPTQGPAVNQAGEWDPRTGVILRNPDPLAAAGTPGGIKDSGVINYLNKAGQLTTAMHKTIDPVSELFYAVVRYFKRQGNVASYSYLGGGNEYVVADGFPVITNWDDPIQNRCQANVILGIGDTDTNTDKNLPGNTVTIAEPATPPEVLADKTVNVVTATNKVGELEGLRIRTPFAGGYNSAYMAGLAYDSHTRDIRADLDGAQTIATHWVDVLESQNLRRKEENPYWLAAKYGGFRVPDGYSTYDRTAPLPDGWWNASGDILKKDYKRPDTFYVASEANRMVESLKKAFTQIASETSGSAAPLTSSSTRLETGTMIYQARFYSPSWRGELSAYAWDATTGRFSHAPAWNAGDRLAAMKWDRRRIYVHNPQATGRRYQLLSWGVLGPAQQSVLADETSVNYLRGDRSNEGRLRVRLGILGDIVNSQPLFVGAPNPRMYRGAKFSGASSYPAFAERQSARRGVVYVGANDGMLHGFDATTGDEVYAFMPAAAINAQLKRLTSPDYEHRYFVDGELTVADVYSSRDGRWKTILAGSMGRGGKAVFALDVTDPDNVGLLWEMGATEIPAMGNVIGKPIIAQVANGDWRVLIGNGPNSAAGAAQLVTIGIESGSIQVRNTGVAGSNGLSGVDAWDGNGDGFYETVYGGDFAGNLWRFEGVGSATIAVDKLFAAKDSGGNPQPITAAPLLLRNPQTRQLWVYFGTGRYLAGRDIADRSEQTWYGVIDDGDEVAGRSALVRRRIQAEVTRGDRGFRATSAAVAGDLSGRDGWFLDLVSPVNGREGERMVVPNSLVGGTLYGTTRIPDARDICSPGGRGFVMGLEPFTGGRRASAAFDANGDGRIDHQDVITVGGAGLSGKRHWFRQRPERSALPGRHR
ncbi:PQQ-binding-like beta-propeller repeat protein [Lysobacter arenosi]|uniref:PQQ-binding-like beta-propeller repeat protein n=1 Tax=Lysobacter arenosi TaxID=2795387 RepID=A0ABX7REV1_9GAMM|nr:PilC/PilY family type IV pilus protein [Lysobacter arenosi]QSX75988.1 PQQ-binding-like beta-propeller repeat protein [Lysobacter arenosi]